MVAKRVALLCLVMTSCVIFLFPMFGQAKEFTVLSGHPRIFITPSTLSKFQSRAATTHSTTYSTIKDWCDSNWGNLSAQKSAIRSAETMVDAGELRYALVYALGQIPGFSYSHTIDQYGDQAVSIIMSRLGDYASFDNIQTIAIAYDWVYPRLSSAQRQSIVDYFHAQSGDSPSVGGPEMQRSGYRISSTPKCLYPVLAFYGDGYKQDIAETYLNFVKTDWFNDLNALFHQAGEDGGHSAGPQYAKNYYPAHYHVHMDFYALSTATTGTLDDFFGSYSYVYGFPLWLLHNIRPGPPSPSYYSSTNILPLNRFEDAMFSHSWNIRSSEVRLMQTLRLMAQVAAEKGDTERAQWITWLIDDILQISYSSTWDIIFNDKTIVASSPSALALPTSKAFGWKDTGVIDSFLGNPKAGLGQVFMRSSWEGLRSNSTEVTYSAFKAPPYFYFGHQHVDSLSFSIFKGEPLVLPNSGVYWPTYEGVKIDYPQYNIGFPHHFHYFERLSGNTLLIMDPDEVIYTQPHHNVYDHSFTDGGQRKLHDSSFSWGSLTEGSVHDTGGLTRHEDTVSYTYTSADATKAYNSTKVSLVQRDFVYLKSNSTGDHDYFLVFDRIDSTQPTFKKVFLLHTIGEPKFDGNLTRIYGINNSGLWESNTTDSFTITQNTAQLFMKTLLPINTKAYKMGGTVTSTITENINSTDGALRDGPKINIGVADVSVFSDHPIVVIDGDPGTLGSTKEAFMCEGKDNSTNTLKNCIRAERYFVKNYPLNHPNGSTVTEYYAWMYREADTGNWISHPFDFGLPTVDNTHLNDCDEYGRWALRIETTEDETHSNFLHVLHPTTDMTALVMDEATLIDAGNMAGSFIKDSSNPWVVLFSKTENLENSLTYQASYSGNGRNLITGLEYAVYDIYRNGTKILTKQTSNQNILYFEALDGGNFQVVKSGEAPNNPPTASVTASSTSGDVPLTVNFSGSGTDSDGTIVAHTWDFGDGQTSTLQNPFHTYDTVGIYTVSLAVTDNGGAVGNDSVNISVSGGQTQNPTPAAPTGLIIANVENPGGQNNPPTASISANPTSGDAPLTVDFTGSGTDADGTIDAFSWNFGDGATSTEHNPSHTYNTAGSYTITLTVTDDDGATGGATAGITAFESGGIGNNPPAASVSANPTTGTPPLTVNFTGTGTDTDGSIVSYLWNFGDGTTSDLQNPSHIFNEAGYYTVSLTVNDNEGAQDSALTNIAVTGTSDFPYVINDFTFYAPPDMPRPEKGVTYQDPNFHTNITRITDSPTDVPGTTYNYAQPGYYKHNIENADGTMLIIQSYRSPFWHIWNANPPYNKIKDLPSSILDSSDADVRWDNNDPNILYSHKGTIFYQWNVGTEIVTKLHDFTDDFPAATYIGMGEEGDASDDRRYWAFFVKEGGYDHTHLIVYDKQADTIVSQLDRGNGTFSLGQSEYYITEGVWIRNRSGGNELNYNWVGMSPSGDYVVTGSPPSWVYPRDFSWTRVLDTAGHVEVGIDDQGNEVMVDAHYSGAPNPPNGVNPGWLRMKDIATGMSTWLAPVGSSGDYPSCNNHDRPGWCAYNNYHPSTPANTEEVKPSAWGQASMMIVKLTRDHYPNPSATNHATVWLVANTHQEFQRYGDKAFGKFNKAGTKLWFGSGWHTSLNDSPQQYDVYQVDLPPNWYQDLK